MGSHLTDTYNFRREEERQRAVQTMTAYVSNKPEQVKFFEELVSAYLKDRTDISVLDACCGIGDLTYYLNLLNPNAKFVGVDRAAFLIDEARLSFAGSSNVSFVELEVNNLAEHFGKKSFDLSVCKQTLSWLPDYKNVVRQLMDVTKEAVFISSLFYDGRIDFETRVREYGTEAGRQDFNAYYNVYSFPIFREYCIANGARDVIGFDFQIGIDLPRPENLDRMGTYTVKLDSGNRLQVSGALLMPWKIVRIDL